MPGRDAAGRLGLGAQIGVAGTGPHDLARPVWPLQDQRVGLFLVPFQPALAAVDPDGQRVLVVDRDLAGIEDATSAIVEAQQQVGVVLERLVVHKHAEVGTQRSDALTGDVLSQLECVGTDVAQAATAAGAQRIELPRLVFDAGRGKIAGQPALWVLDHDLADAAQFAAQHAGPCLLHHRIATVVVGQAEETPAAPHQVHQLLRLPQGRGHGLLAEYVEPGLQRPAGDGGVQVVGRDDGDKVDTLGGWSGGLGQQHFVVRGIDSSSRQEKLSAGLL